MNPKKEDSIDSELRKIMEIPDDQELPDEALCDVMIRALESQQLLIRSAAVHQLITLGKKNPTLAIPKILKALDPVVDYWTVRFGALEALGEISNKSTVKPLIEYLKTDSDPDFRAMVAKQLGEMGDNAIEAGTSLINALNDKENSEIRENAAHALGLLKNKDSIDPILQVLKIEPDEYARREMCWSLGELQDPKVIPILLKTLKDKDKGVRCNSVEALGKIKCKDAIVPILEACKDENLEVQSKAIWALKQFSDETIISEIEQVAKNDSLVALQYFDDFLFNVNSEIISKRVIDLKKPILDEYNDRLLQIKTELDSYKLFVDDTFQKLTKLSLDEINSLIQKEIPLIESRIAGINLYEYRKYRWIEKSLFFELDKINKLYRDSGVMISELRDNILILQKKKEEEQRKTIEESSDDERNKV